MPERATVLIVEDERELADLFADWLTDSYDVRTAYSAADALDELDEETDVVLLDRRLPERSGDDVLQTIRDRGLDCQVAMVTAVDPDFDTLELGFDAYVVKPVERDELEPLVKRLLARSLYNEEVQRYFALASRRATIETTKTDAELANDDRYQQLCADIAELRSNLDQRITDLDDDDFLAVFHDLQTRE
ncbi:MULTISPECIES: HalX domain-containing protein [Halobacterium]|uniref:HalX domain-containing protein n=1 Tax=Halobacterium TaxID=2239 RepID=UPI00073F8821|nr:MULTISPECIES: HalX domain-containing protein [Halobacterium]MCG1003362.1 HalX domain-containing protein [Halobacterium noricense]